MIQTTAPALLAALNGASSKIKPAQSMTALEHVEIGSRAVFATDLGIQGEQKYAAEGGDETFLLQRAALKRILSKIGDSPIAIVATGEQGESALISLPNGSAFTLAQLPVAEYPKAMTPPVVFGIDLTVPAATFRNMLEHALVAASKDESRPVLTGILLEVHPDGFAVVGCDSYRLHVLEHGETGPGDGKRALLPGRFVEALVERIKKLKPDTVTIASDHGTDGYVRVTVGDYTGSARLIAGTYPDWRRLMPDPTGDDRYSAVLPAAAMLAAIDLAEAATPAKHNTPLRLAVGPNASTISIDGHQGAAFSAPLDMLYDAAPDGGFADGMELGFNAAFLADMIAASQSDSPILSMIAPLRPSWITSVGCAQCGTPIDGHGVSFRGLLMPIRLT